MCFSATASFVAAGLLASIGGISLYRTKKSSLAALATIPLLFAVQQATEGVVWLTVHDPNSMVGKIAVFIFIFFASCWWPIWIPGVIRVSEKNRLRRQLLWIPQAAGILFVLCAYIPIFRYGAHASVTPCNHLAYATSNEYLLLPVIIVNFLYGFAVVMPCFISSLQKIWILGIGIIGGYLVAYQWFPAAIGSVWCFFAAIISLSVLYIIMSNAKNR